MRSVGEVAEIDCILQVGLKRSLIPRRHRGNKKLPADLSANPKKLNRELHGQRRRQRNTFYKEPIWALKSQCSPCMSQAGPRRSHLLLKLESSRARDKTSLIASFPLVLVMRESHSREAANTKIK